MVSVGAEYTGILCTILATFLEVYIMPKVAKKKKKKMGKNDETPTWLYVIKY